MTKKIAGVPIPRELWVRHQGRNAFGAEGRAVLDEWLSGRPSGRDVAHMYERAQDAVRLYLLQHSPDSALTKPLFESVWKTRSEQVGKALLSNPNLRGSASNRFCVFLARVIDSNAGRSTRHGFDAADQWLVELGVEGSGELAPFLDQWNAELSTALRGRVDARLTDLAAALITLDYGPPSRRAEIWAIGMGQASRFLHRESSAFFQRAPLRGLATSLLGHFHRPEVRLALASRTDFWKSIALVRRVLEAAGEETIAVLLDSLDERAFRIRFLTVYGHVPAQALRYLSTHSEKIVMLTKTDLSEMLRTPHADARLEAIRLASILFGTECGGPAAGARANTARG